MEVISKQYKIGTIVDMKDRIDPKPQYQRTPVWKIDRKRLLLDSIFRKYDLPKFYFNKLVGNAFYDYEVCDGQQRLRTIWEFRNNELVLNRDTIFEGKIIGGVKYSELETDVKIFFDNYTLTVTTISNAAQNEIRDLFARLQKGMGLNQAELRRALSTQIGAYVESIVNNHNFFKVCGFDDSRNKHQDYIDHVIAYMVNGFNNDFKGPILKEVYTTLSPIQTTPLIKDITLILDEMEKVNKHCIGIFKNKWAFVDTFILIYQNKNKKLNYKEFAKEFKEFESLRKLHNRNPSTLIEKDRPSSQDKRLYEYIISFSKEGSLKSNMTIRNSSFTNQFEHFFK